MLNERQNTYVNWLILTCSPSDSILWSIQVKRNNNHNNKMDGIANLSTVIICILPDWKRSANNEKALGPRIDVSVRQMSITNAHNCLFCVQPAAFLINKLACLFSNSPFVSVWFWSFCTFFVSLFSFPSNGIKTCFIFFLFWFWFQFKHATVIGQQISK